MMSVMVVVGEVKVGDDVGDGGGRRSEGGG